MVICSPSESGTTDLHLQTVRLTIRTSCNHTAKILNFYLSAASESRREKVVTVITVLCLCNPDSRMFMPTLIDFVDLCKHMLVMTVMPGHISNKSVNTICLQMIAKTRLWFWSVFLSVIIWCSPNWWPVSLVQQHVTRQINNKKH